MFFLIMIFVVVVVVFLHVESVNSRFVIKEIVLRNVWIAPSAERIKTKQCLFINATAKGAIR